VGLRNGREMGGPFPRGAAFAPERDGALELFEVLSLEVGWVPSGGFFRLCAIVKKLNKNE
jgi:hypothetical protein